MKNVRNDAHHHPRHEKNEDEKSEQMCCDGERTADEHRKESEDGKCCTD